MTLRTWVVCIILVHAVWLRQYGHGTDGLLRTRYAGYVFGSIGKIVTVYGVRGLWLWQYVRGERFGSMYAAARMYGVRGGGHLSKQYTHF
jgi:hypothetical protein